MSHSKVCLNFDISSALRTSRVIYKTNLYSDMVLFVFMIITLKGGSPLKTYTSYLHSILTKLVGLLIITKMTKVNKEFELDTWM